MSTISNDTIIAVAISGGLTTLRAPDWRVLTVDEARRLITREGGQRMAAEFDRALGSLSSEPFRLSAGTYEYGTAIGLPRCVVIARAATDAERTRRMETDERERREAADPDHQARLAAYREERRKADEAGRAARDAAVATASDRIDVMIAEHRVAGRWGTAA